MTFEGIKGGPKEKKEGEEVGGGDAVSLELQFQREIKVWRRKKLSKGTGA